MKKLQRRAKRFKGFTIGLDLHQKFIQFSVFDRRGNEAAAGRIAPDRTEVLKLIERWEKSGQVQVVFEACGCFVWVFDLLAKKLGRDQVHVAQPLKIAVIAKSQEKTDASDAWWLAYLLYEGRLPEAYVSEGTLRELKLTGRELRSYTEMRSDLARRVRSHLAQEGLTLPKGWHTSKRKREVVVEALKQVAGVRGEALQELYTQVEKLTEIICRWRKRLDQLSAGFPAIEVIKEEMPGIKDVTAGLIYGELGDPTRYYSAKAYAKATGLIPGLRETGGKRQRCPITRAGSRHARWAFTRAVIACLRCKRGVGLQVRQWVENQCKRKAKCTVVVAAARKLAEGVWRLLAWGEAFDLRRAFPT
jgi:transposase